MTTIETVEALDEARAREIDHFAFDMLDSGCGPKITKDMTSRAIMARETAIRIRQADERAGLVTVPLRATTPMCIAMDMAEPETLWQEVWAAAVAASPFAQPPGKE